MKPEKTIANMTMRDALRCFQILIRLNYEGGVPTELWEWQELAEHLTQKPTLTPAYLGKAGKLIQNEYCRRKLRRLTGQLKEYHDFLALG